MSLSALPWVRDASDLDPLDLAAYAQPYELDSYTLGTSEVYSKIIAADGVQLDMPASTFWYNDGERNDDAITGTFGWKNPPFGGAGGAGDDNTAIYGYDNWTYADKGLYKLWREDGSAGGYYTVELQWSQAQKGMEYQLIFTCRANDSWDDLSDEC